MEIMDIANLSMSLAQSKAMNGVGVAMLSKSLDNMRAEGAEIVQLINSVPASHAAELSVNPDLGANIDVYA